MKKFGSVQATMRAPLAAWQGTRCLGNAKIAQLQAALELGRRAALPEKLEEMRIRSTQQAADYFKVRLRGLAEEHFPVAFLDRRGPLLNESPIAAGTVDTVRPHIRTIAAHDLRTNASALVASHYHPSGAAEPSESDKLLTRDMIAACHPIRIKVLDHVIVAGDNHFSFADAGLLDELSLETLAPAPRTTR
jgi:DNA repair protein RadC